MLRAESLVLESRSPRAPRGLRPTGCRHASITTPEEGTCTASAYGIVTDPYGHKWAIATRKEDLTPEEMDRRGKEFMAQMGQSR